MSAATTRLLLGLDLGRRLLLPRRIGLGQRHLALLLDVLLDRRAHGALAGGAPLVVLQQLPRRHAPAAHMVNVYQQVQQ